MISKEARFRLRAHTQPAPLSLEIVPEVDLPVCPSREEPGLCGVPRDVEAAQLLARRHCVATQDLDGDDQGVLFAEGEREKGGKGEGGRSEGLQNVTSTCPHPPDKKTN
jgi:hypothetical protein